jgi:hypothetical protein
MFFKKLFLLFLIMDIDSYFLGKLDKFLKNLTQ